MRYVLNVFRTGVYIGKNTIGYENEARKIDDR